MVNNSIDDRCCHYIVLKNLPPILKVVIAGQDNRPFLISNKDELKQKISLFFRTRHISQLIDDQQVEPRIGLRVLG